MCARAVNTYSFVFDSVPNWFKTQEMCDKAVDDYPSTITFVTECFKSQEECIKTVNFWWINSP